MKPDRRVAALLERLLEETYTYADSSHLLSRTRIGSYTYPAANGCSIAKSSSSLLLSGSKGSMLE